MSEDSGCGLFAYRIYEELKKKTMEVLDAWLLLFILYPGLYNNTDIQNVYNAIRKKLKPV